MSAVPTISQTARSRGSNDGHTILYTSYTFPKALKIDTNTGAISEIGTPIGNEPGSVAYRTDGLVYFLRNRQLTGSI